MQQMIIANRLADGVVVFLGSSDQWVTSIDDGSVFEQGPPAEQALAVAKRHETESLVVDPAAIEVSTQDGRLRPTAIREAIRAFGPTIRTDLAGDGTAAVEAWR